MEERRQFPRSAFMADVFAQVLGRRLRLFVYDLSMDGCMVQTADLEVIEGQTIILEFDESCTTIGKVLWKRNITAGMKFESRLEPAVVNRLVKAAENNSYAQELSPIFDRSVLKVEHRKVDPPKF
jgi:hypothetical protein